MVITDCALGMLTPFSSKEAGDTAFCFLYFTTKLGQVLKVVIMLLACPIRSLQ